MDGQRTPPIELGTMQDMLAFWNNKDRIAEYVAQVTAIVEKNEAILASIGKAKDIDRLHAETEELKAVVLANIEKREKALKKDREKFRGEMAAEREKIANEQHVSGQEITETRNEAKAKLTSAAEAEKAAKDTLVAARKDEKVAQKAKADGIALKARYEQMIEGIQAATAGAV